MSMLEIRRSSGEVQHCELTRDGPLLAGSLPSCDIRLAEEDAAPVHCRFTWVRNGYQVLAATPDGVLYNGSLLPQARLNPGDVVQIGGTTLTFMRGLDHDGTNDDDQEYRLADPAAGQAQPVVFLKPAVGAGAVQGARSGSPGPAPSPRGGAPEPSPAAQPIAARGEEQAADEKEAKRAKPAAAPREEPPKPAPRGAENIDFNIDSVADDPGPRVALRAPRGALGRAGKAARGGEAQRPAASGLGRAVRPGERELLKSPLVLGLGAAAFFLLLGTATLWFFLNREATQQQFDSAARAFETGQLAQAIQGFEAFLQAHPHHASAPAARRLVAQSRVEQALGGAAPDWDAGLQALENYLTEFRDRPEFEPHDSELRVYAVKSAQRLALGAALAARQTAKPRLLEVSLEGSRLLENYGANSGPSREELQAITVAQKAAETALLRHSIVERFQALIDAALESEQPLAALARFRELVQQDEIAPRQKSLQEKVKKALELDRRSIQRVESEQAALSGDVARGPTPLVLARRTRARSDEPPAGTIVLAVAGESCVAVDAATGEPQWRRNLGADSPFVPIPVEGAVPALLACDMRRLELLLLERRTGRAIWRQALGERPVAAPLIYEGQIYLPTAASKLWQIDLGTGQASAWLTFSQPLACAPVASRTGDQLYALGREGVVYELTRRPLGCVRAMYLGHAPGAIGAPALILRDRLLVFENDRAKSCLGRLVELSSDNPLLQNVAAVRMLGQVRSPAVVRGNLIFVGTVPERLHALTVAETNDEHALTVRASRESASPGKGPLFLTAGPDDQVWAAGQTLRRLELLKNEFRTGRPDLPVGQPVQPLQMHGSDLYFGKQPPGTGGNLFARVDRDKMQGRFQVAVGVPPLGCSPSRSGSKTMACVTSIGDVFQISEERAGSGGFELQTVAQLPLPEGAGSLAVTPLPDGRLLAYQAQVAAPRGWLIGSDGGLQGELTFPGPLQAPPTLLGDTWLAPVPGQIRLLDLKTTSSTEGLLLPLGSDPPPEWLSVERSGERQALALTTSGRLMRLELRGEPTRHLAEVSHWDAVGRIDLAPAVLSQRVVLTDREARVTLLSSSALEPLGEITLQQPAAQSPWVVGNQVLVNVGRSALRALDLDRELAGLWSAPIEGLLAGPPLAVPQGVLVALQNGRVRLLAGDTGLTLREIDLGETLCGGPLTLGERRLVLSSDGALFDLSPWLAEPLP